MCSVRIPPFLCFGKKRGKIISLQQYRNQREVLLQCLSPPLCCWDAKFVICYPQTTFLPFVLNFQQLLMLMQQATTALFFLIFSLKLYFFSPRPWKEAPYWDHEYIFTFSVFGAGTKAFCCFFFSVMYSIPCRGNSSCVLFGINKIKVINMTQRYQYLLGLQRWISHFWMSI